MILESFVAKVPTNIALLKYWGKSCSHSQWPANDSLSLTLSNLGTTTSCSKNQGLEHKLYLGEKEIDPLSSFGKKVFSHLDFLAKKLDTRQKLTVTTKNNFPSSCGIASSASGLGALTIAALACWTQSKNLFELNRHYSIQKLAHWARMGSGSACRSLLGGTVLWSRGNNKTEQTIKELFPYEHWSLADIVMVLSKSEKSISSTQAHKLAWTSPLYKIRLAGLDERKERIITALREKKISQLGPLLEEEALEMHSVIMTSTPPIQYLTEKSLTMMSYIRRLRKDLDFQIYFTIDAGANLHLICEEKNQQKYMKRILQDHPMVSLLVDRIGQGPTLEQTTIYQ